MVYEELYGGWIRVRRGRRVFICVKRKGGPGGGGAWSGENVIPTHDVRSRPAAGVDLTVGGNSGERICSEQTLS